MDKTYVFDGIEVIKTGRVAIKKKTTLSGKEYNSELVEIKPIDKYIEWTKWVIPGDLFEVIEK